MRLRILAAWPSGLAFASGSMEWPMAPSPAPLGALCVSRPLSKNSLVWYQQFMKGHLVAIDEHSRLRLGGV